MRVVLWNTGGGFVRDLPPLRSLQPDLAILVEAPQRPPIDREPGVIDWNWCGPSRSKGLALAAFANELTVVELGGRPHWALAARHVSGIHVVGVWPDPDRDPAAQRQEIKRTLSVAAQPGPTIVGISSDRVLFEPNDEPLEQLLGEYELTSVHHHRSGEAIGAETSPTTFPRGRIEHGHHSDHLLVSTDLVDRITGFQIGHYADWVRGADGEILYSDHVPLVLDLS